MIDVDKLEEVAKAASRGQWKHEQRLTGQGEVNYDTVTIGPEWVPLAYDGDGGHADMIERDAAYVAAAQPSIVLELIAELRALREVERAHDVAMLAIYDAVPQPMPFAMKVDVLRGDLADALVKLGDACAEVAAADQRMAGVLDATFSVGDGTAQREIERLRAAIAEVELALDGEGLQPDLGTIAQRVRILGREESKHASAVHQAHLALTRAGHRDSDEPLHARIDALADKFDFQLRRAADEERRGRAAAAARDAAETVLYGQPLLAALDERREAKEDARRRREGESEHGALERSRGES